MRPKWGVRMKSLLLRSLILVVSTLALSTAGAWAAGKSHVGVPVGQILNLRTFAPNDGSGGHTFSYDLGGPVFTVPQGMVFVVTDVRVFPVLTGGAAATQEYVIEISFDNSGKRRMILRFLGASYERSFTTGFVVPAGSTPSAVTYAGSHENAEVSLHGYLVKGTALPVDAGF